MQKILLPLLLFPVLFPAPVFAKDGQQSNQIYADSREHAEIESVLREIEFLKERVQALQSKYERLAGKRKIRFNYRALLDQLTVTGNGIRDYLNARIDAIHLTPPQPLARDLTTVRAN